jgi:hypothetical protein
MAPLTYIAIPERKGEYVMREGDYVRLEKVGCTPGGIPACPMPLYSPGAWDGVLSLPRSYWMDGYFVETPMRGHPIRLRRYVRLGVVADGYFQSSRIQTIKGDLIVTYNSVWQVRRVPPIELKTLGE